MTDIDVIGYEEFLNILNLNFKDGEKYFFHIQTWQDGNSFLDICDDDGGLKSEHYILFNERNKKHIFIAKTDLLKLINEYIKIKSFASKNEVYKLGYEIIISCKNDYFVLCPGLNKGYYTKLSLTNRFIGFFNYKEPWEEEKFGYWEKQKIM